MGGAEQLLQGLRSPDRHHYSTCTSFWKICGRLKSYIPLSCWIFCANRISHFVHQSAYALSIYWDLKKMRMSLAALTPIFMYTNSIYIKRCFPFKGRHHVGVSSHHFITGVKLANEMCLVSNNSLVVSKRIFSCKAWNLEVFFETLSSLFIEQTKGVRCAMPGVENRLFAKISMLGRCCIMLLILPCCLHIENMDGTKAGTSTTLEHPGSLWSKIRMAHSSITPPLKLNVSALCSSFLKAVKRPGFPYVQLGVAVCANEKEKAVQSCLRAQISWKSSWPVAAWVEDFKQMGFDVTANTTPVHHSSLQIEVVVSDSAARYQSGKLLKRREWSVCMVNFWHRYPVKDITLPR